MTPGAPLAITGVGAVSPVGVGRSALEAGLGHEAPPEARPRPPSGVPQPGCVVAFVPEFDAESHADPRTLRKVSALSRLATVAAAECLAGWDAPPARRTATGVFLGTALGSSGDHLAALELLARGGTSAMSALLFAESVFNAAASHVAKVHALRGANWTTVGGEATGLDAVVAAVRQLRQGAVDAALAGGADHYEPRVHASLAAQHIAGADGCGAIGEGAALFLLEPLDRARREGRPVLARLLGIGQARRGRRPVGPEPAVEAMALALADADSDALAVDLVVTGGGATPAGALEDAALGQAAGVANGHARVTPLERWTGAGLAGTAALRLAVAVHALAVGRYPPPSPGTPAPPGRPRRALVLVATATGAACAVLVGTED